MKTTSQLRCQDLCLLVVIIHADLYVFLIRTIDRIKLLLISVSSWWNIIFKLQCEVGSWFRWERVRQSERRLGGPAHGALLSLLLQLSAISIRLSAIYMYMYCDGVCVDLSFIVYVLTYFSCLATLLIITTKSPNRNQPTTRVVYIYIY